MNEIFVQTKMWLQYSKLVIKGFFGKVEFWLREGKMKCICLWGKEEWLEQGIKIFIS